MAIDVTGIGTAITGIKDLVGMFFPDKTAEDQAKMVQAFQIMQLQATADQGQMAVNQAEAAQPGLHFRDGAGWVCVAGFAVTVLRPLIQWGSVLFNHPVVLPEMDMTQIGPMLAALLGLGGMHVYQQTQSK